MNSGLRDSMNLSWKIACVLRGVAAPSLLMSYEEERKEMNRNMIEYAMQLGEIVVPKTQRDIHQSKQLGQKIMAGGFKPVTTSTNGFYWPVGRDLFTAQVLPQPIARVLSPWGASIHGHVATERMYPGVSRATSESSCLLDDLLGPLFTLVGVGAVTAPAFTSPLLPPVVSRLLLLREGQRVPRGCGRSGGAVRYATLPKDMPTDLFAPLCKPGTVLLVRPDKYVYGAVHFSSCEDLLRHFQKHLLGDHLQMKSQIHFPGNSRGPTAVAARL